jgi:hypothetical protein
MMIMDLDEPELTEPRPGESAATFEGRLRMLRRLGPIVRKLGEHGFAIVVESDRRTPHAVAIESDLVIEYGDVRVRVLLWPGEREPLKGHASRDHLAHYFLDVPDTDAVAVVSDDDLLSTLIMDVYDAHDVGAQMPPSRPFADAIAEFFTANVFAVELPDFRTVLALPSEAELRARLEGLLRDTFGRIKTTRARIPEKIAALEALGIEDVERVIACVTGAIEGDVPAIEALLAHVEGMGS